MLEHVRVLDQLLGKLGVRGVQRARLEKVFRTDDRTDELGAAWGIKEQVRLLIKTSSLTDAHEAKMLLGHYVQVANMPETDRLWNTICDGYPM